MMNNFIHFTPSLRLCCGGSRIYCIWRGHQPRKRVLSANVATFKKPVCQNERIGTLGGSVPAAPPPWIRQCYGHTRTFNSLLVLSSSVSMYPSLTKRTSCLNPSLCGSSPINVSVSCMNWDMLSVFSSNAEAWDWLRDPRVLNTKRRTLWHVES